VAALATPASSGLVASQLKGCSKTARNGALTERTRSGLRTGTPVGTRAPRTDGLPPAYSGHNSFWYWGPPPASATSAVVVGYSRDQLGFCRSLRLALKLSNHQGVSDDEQGQPVWICAQLAQSWRALWPSQRYLG
jgi:hypothetical protein